MSKLHDELHDAQVFEIACLLAMDEIETGQGGGESDQGMKASMSKDKYEPRGQ